MVPENLAMTEFWLGNCIEIGEIGLRFWNKDLKGKIWSVAPLSKIQEEKEKIKHVGLVVHWWTTVAMEEESFYWIKARRASYCSLEKPNWASALSSFLAWRSVVEETVSTILAWVEGLEGGGWTLVCRLEPWGKSFLIQQESEVWLVRWQWSQYLGLRPPDRGKHPRPWLPEKPPRKVLPIPRERQDWS